MTTGIFRKVCKYFADLSNFNNDFYMSLTEVNRVGRFLQQLACTTKCDNYTIIDFKIRMIRRMIDKLDNFDGK